MLTNPYPIYRQAISIVDQAWNQLDNLLPGSLHEEKKAVREAFQKLREALFKVEIEEAKNTLNKSLSPPV